MKNNRRTKIKTGDTVIVLSGDSKGETGVVKQVNKSDYTAVVEGVNMVKKHVRPTAEAPGGIVDKEAPLHLSKLMLVDANGVASRTKVDYVDGKKVRKSKKTQEVI